MPKKVKKIEDHLQAIEYLLAGILLKRELDIKKVAKIIGCSDNTLTDLFPTKRKGGKSVPRTNETIEEKQN